MQARELMVTTPKTVGADARAADVRAQLEDDHVHLVLVVDHDGRLLTTIERRDLRGEPGDSSPASALGSLDGRVVAPTTPETTITRLLDSGGRRRLAVVDGEGRLLGLVCRNRSRTGYCDDEGVRDRATDRAATPPAQRPQRLP